MLRLFINTPILRATLHQKTRARTMSSISYTVLPTLSDAYADGTLKAVGEQEQHFEGRKEINDKVSLWQGDITELEVDGIQNAANSGLRGGGGIDGAIHRAAGPKLLEACRQLGGCETGNTKVTTGFNLPSKFVLHTVGPIYSSSKAEWCSQRLASCYRTTLDLARSNEMSSVALCGVSTGVYGFPLREATEIALRTTREYLEELEEASGRDASKSAEKAWKGFERIVFCNFGSRDVRIYNELTPYYFPPPSSAAKDAMTESGEAVEER